MKIYLFNRLKYLLSGFDSVAVTSAATEFAKFLMTNEY